MPANVISGFAPGDTIDLAGVPYDSSGYTTLFSGGNSVQPNAVLGITEGGSTYYLQFDPSQNFQNEVFQLSSDGKGGTDIKLIQNTSLFTAGADTVNFNSLTGPQIAAINAAPTQLYNGLGGNDTVTLPTEDANGNYVLSPAVNAKWDPSQTFYAGDTTGQSCTITGGTGHTRYP
jgi:hypothetical protein